MADRSRTDDVFYRQLANVLRAQIMSADTSRPILLAAERDLERLHHVSRTTVRKALDLLEREGLIERTHGRRTIAIPAAVERAQRLRQRRIVYVVTRPGHLPGVVMSYYGQIYQGVMAAVERAGYLVRVHSMQRHELFTVRHKLQPPSSGDILGVILLGIPNEQIVQACVDGSYPVVSVDYYTINPKADAVMIDCFGEGQIAADYLFRQGHSQVFYMGHTFSSKQREPDSELVLAGIRHSLVEMGLPDLPPERAVFLPDHAPEILQAVDEFLALRPRPTAAIVFSHWAAEVFSDALRSRGIQCPEDVSLITKSTDGLPCFFTCMSANARRLGEISVKCLMERVAGDRSEVVRLAIPSRLRLYRSVRDLLGAGEADRAISNRPA